jgi:hypothetical protein
MQLMLRTTARRRVVAARLVAAVAAGSSPYVAAFKPGVHEGVTDEALQASGLNVNPPIAASSWEFSSDARAKIESANWWVDGWDLGGVRPWPGVPAHHFDDNLLHDGAEYLLKKRAEIMSSLSKAEQASAAGLDFDGEIKDAWTSLGRAHHTLQDFYAHSTWADTGRPGIAPMVWAFGDRKNPFPSNPVANHCACGSLPPVSTELLTETFNVPFERMTVSARQGLCIHGPAYPNSSLGIEPIAGCPVNLPGIAKDDSSKGALFTEAREKAVLATAAFTQSILLEAKEKQYFAALCGFLGAKDSRSCHPQTTPVTARVTLPFYSFGTGTYKTDETFGLDLPKFDGSLGQLLGVTTDWTFTYAGTATCPQPPSSAIPAANTCLAIRRMASMSITSPDIGAYIGTLYCNTQTAQTSLCGFGDFPPDNLGFSYLLWPGGIHSLGEPFKKSFRSLGNAGPIVAAKGGETFHVDGSFTSRLLFFLGIDNGYPAKEPSSYTASGQYLSFAGNLEITATITYEYVPLSQ